MAGRWINGQYFVSRRDVEGQQGVRGYGANEQQTAAGFGGNGYGAGQGRGGIWQEGMAGRGWIGNGGHYQNYYGTNMYTGPGTPTVHPAIAVPPSLPIPVDAERPTGPPRARRGRLGSKAHWNFYEEQAKAKARPCEQGSDDDESFKQYVKRSSSKLKGSEGRKSKNTASSQESNNETAIDPETFSIASLNLACTSGASSAATFATQLSIAHSTDRLCTKSLEQVDGASMSPSQCTPLGETVAPQKASNTSVASIRSGASEHDEFYTKEQQLLEKKLIRETAERWASEWVDPSSLPSKFERGKHQIDQSSNVQSSRSSSMIGEGDGPVADVTWLLKKYMSQIESADAKIANRDYNLMIAKEQLNQKETELSELQRYRVSYPQAQEEIGRLVDTIEGLHFDFENERDSYLYRISALEQQIEGMTMSGYQTNPFYGFGDVATPSYYQQPYAATAYSGVQPPQYGYSNQDQRTPAFNFPYQSSSTAHETLPHAPNLRNHVLLDLSPTPTPRQPWNRAEFERRSYQDVLNYAFSKVESVVRQVRLDTIRTSRPPQEVRKLIDAAAALVQDHAFAIEFLHKPEDKISVVIGIINRAIVEKVFKQPVFDKLDPELGIPFIAAIREEETAAKSNKRRDYVHRRELAMSRAATIDPIISQLGFWKKLHKHSRVLAGEIVSEVRAAFVPQDIQTVNREVGRAVNNALRIAIRMRGDPTEFEFGFIPCGIAFEPSSMVHRNEGLIGETLTGARTPWSTAVCLFPLVRANDFGNINTHPQVIHKAEVVLIERKLCLRSGQKNLRSNLPRGFR